MVYPWQCMVYPWQCMVYPWLSTSRTASLTTSCVGAGRSTGVSITLGFGEVRGSILPAKSVSRRPLPVSFHRARAGGEKKQSSGAGAAGGRAIARLGGVSQICGWISVGVVVGYMLARAHNAGR